ncbi:Outer membrane protein OmpA [Cyclobacterium lianum]|uniref:Outer membrane protein OmpA n=1 Tax=Cyclobacterium lianum TaxID=388280 RepID=A0A1M7LKT9_9BACT|nr:OmpA family protein [Cyclobacterium lianum]SHM78765.1 Outer membrane protein OmpA [Cyclobacterium lianum]
MIRKSLPLFYFLLLFATTSSYGQLYPYKWRVGLGTDFSRSLNSYQINKFSDLKRIYELDQPLRPEKNWTLSIEKRLSPGLSLALSGSRYTLSETSPNGAVQNSGILRIREIETTATTFGTSLMLRTDNGKLLGENAFFAPYLSIGAGWIYREGKGQQVKMAIEPLPTIIINEDSGFEYSKNNLYWSAGFGTRLKVSKQLEVFFQSDIEGNLSQINDENTYFGMLNQSAPLGKNSPPLGWLVHHRMGLKFSFVPSEKAYRASVINPSTKATRQVLSAETQPSENENGLLSLNATVSLTERGINVTTQAKPEPMKEADPGISDRTGANETIYYYSYPGSPDAGQQGTRFRPEASQNRIVYGHSGFEEYGQRSNQYGYQDIRRSGTNSTGIPLRSTQPDRSASWLFWVPPIAALSSLNNAADPTLPAAADSSGFQSNIPKSPEPMQKRDINPVYEVNRAPVPSKLFNPGFSNTIFIPVPVTTHGDSLKKERMKLPVTRVMIYFENAKSELSAPAFEKLKEIAGTLYDYPKAAISIKGFADHTGSISYNMALIEKRSQAVAEVLRIQHGIPADRIQLLPGALLVRSEVKKPRKEDRVVELQILF